LPSVRVSDGRSRKADTENHQTLRAAPEQSLVQVYEQVLLPARLCWKQAEWLLPAILMKPNWQQASEPVLDASSTTRCPVRRRGPRELVGMAEFVSYRFGRFSNCGGKSGRQ